MLRMISGPHKKLQQISSGLIEAVSNEIGSDCSANLSRTSWWWSDLCLTNPDPGTGANSQVKVATIPTPKMPPI